jgi:hypothetical protein
MNALEHEKLEQKSVVLKKTSSSLRMPKGKIFFLIMTVSIILQKLGTITTWDTPGIFGGPTLDIV